MQEENIWKKSDVVIPERDVSPNVQADPLLSPITGDSSGGLDNIGTDLKEVLDTSDEPKIDLSKALNIIDFTGKPDHIEKFKHVAGSQVEENSMGSAQTPSGIPIGLVYSLIGQTQKFCPDLDLTKDKIIVNVKLRDNCKKCCGRGYIGRISDPVTLEVTEKLFKCSCVKIVLDVEKGQPEENGDVDSDSKP